MNEYRIVSTEHHGYFVLVANAEAGWARIRRANQIGISDALGPGAKLQMRREGVQGDDSTWTEVVDETSDAKSQVWGSF